MTDGVNSPKLRLPLQTGDTAVMASGIAAMCFGLAVPFVAVFVVGIQSRDNTDKIITILESMYAIPLLLVVAYELRLVWRAKPSDIILSNEGCTIIGGVSYGTSLVWSNVRACAFHRDETKEKLLGAVAGSDAVVSLPDTVPVRPNETAILRLTLQEGSMADLATSTRPEEFESLDALRQTIVALLARSETELPEPTKALRVHAFPCRGCTAPLHPTADATATCPFCALVNEVPPTVREKVATSAKLSEADASIERYVSRVQGETQLGRVRLTMLTVWIAAAAFVLALGVAASLFLYGYTRASGLGGLVAAGVLLVPAIAMLGFGACIDRRAARFFSLGLRATPGSRRGEPSSCRQCGASLPTPPDGAVVVRCVYCQADNVLGVDLRVRLARDEAQSKSVEATTRAAERARGVWRWRGRVVGAACLVCALTTLAFVTFRRPVAAQNGARDLTRITWDPFESAKQPTLSPDGRLIAYTRAFAVGKGPHALTFGLVVAPAAGGFGRKLTDDSNPFESPEWFPDGTALYGTLHFDGSPESWTLVTARLDRSNNKNQGVADSQDNQPRIRPNAPKRPNWSDIALVRGGRVIVDKDDFGPGTHPAWFSDGNRIAFTRGDAIWQATVRDAPLAQRVPTVSCPVDFAAPDPGGRRIAYVATCQLQSEVVVQTLDGQSTTTLTRGRSKITDLRWQREWLYFTADDAVFRLRLPR